MNTFGRILAPGVLLLLMTVPLHAQQGGASAPAYVGSNACKKCHLKQYKSWEKTRMAKSFDALKPGANAAEKKKAGLDPNKDYTADKKCLPCHTTGYGSAGGFVSLEKTPDRAGVGCEMCHGPGSIYTREEHMSLKNKEYKLADLVKVGLVNPPKEATCTATCHNKNSPFFQSFDFVKRVKEGTHEHAPLKYKH